MADKVTESVSTNPYQMQTYSAGQNDRNTLTITDFFKLMAAQLSNQDVSDPMSNSELMAQMTQMAMVQSMTTMTETMETMTKAMENSQAVATQTYAAGLVGQEVTVAVIGEDEDGNPIPVGVKTGKVVSVDFTTATPTVRLEGDNTEYSLTQVLGMGAIKNPFQNVNPDGSGDTSGTEGDGTGGTEGAAGSGGGAGESGGTAGTEGAAGTESGTTGTEAAGGTAGTQSGAAAGVTGTETAGAGKTDAADPAEEKTAADQAQNTGTQAAGQPEENSKTGAMQGAAGTGQNEAPASAGTQIPSETEQEVGSAAAGAADAEHMVNTDDTAADRTASTDNTEKTEPAQAAERME